MVVHNKVNLIYIHCPPKVKVQPVLMLSCFAHFSWINEHKDMKLGWNIYYETIIKFYAIGASENICKWILMNFFEKLCFEKWENINVFWKGNKTKGGNKVAL